MRTTFRGPSGAHLLTFTGQDSSVLPALGPRASGSELPLLAMIGAAYRSKCTYSRTEILEAAIDFRDALEQHRDFLGYRYIIEFTMPGQREALRGGKGGASGFRIEGKIHSIWTGAGTCYLKEYAVEADGTGREVRTIDVRDRKQLETDDWGPIRIYRRKLKITLFDTVPSLISFLENSPDQRLRVTMSG